MHSAVGDVVPSGTDGAARAGGDSSVERLGRAQRNAKLTFPHPPNEEVERALISSAADESKVNQNIEVKVKAREQADAVEDETDDDLRPIIRKMVGAKFPPQMWSCTVSRRRTFLHEVGDLEEHQQATACLHIGIQVVLVLAALCQEHLSCERWWRCHLGVPRRVVHGCWRRLLQTKCTSRYRAYRDVEDGEHQVVVPGALHQC